MLVYKPKKALVLRLRDPQRVTTVIPSAKIINHDGKDYVAVRHGVDEVRVLRNLGIKAPSPILYYYDWPGQFTPFNHQRETAGFLTTHDRAFNLNDIGTGKTISTLWSYDYLRSIGRAQKLLVVTPLSTLERTWGDELFTSFPHLNYTVLHGSRDKRLKLLDNRDFDVYLINHDGIKVRGLLEALADRPDINVIAIDELAQIARSAGAERFRVLRTITCKQHERIVWGLTGTPTPNSPTDAWAQCQIISPKNVPSSMKRFKESVMRQVGTFSWVPRPEAQKVVQDAMQPAIRYTRDECIDLPPCVYQTRSVELTSEQRAAYKNMLETLHHEVDSGEVTAVNAAVKAQKLIQIACGVAYGNDGEPLLFDASSRLSVVEEVIREAGTKVIVFVPFVAVLEMVAEHLKDAGITVEIIHGGVSKTERDRIFNAFMKTDTPHVLVAQPASMSHGLTLTAASTIVWYAPVTSNDTFEQANGRITRPGQKHSQLIVMVEGTDIERKYYKRLKEKQSAQNILLEMIRSERTETEALATTF